MKTVILLLIAICSFVEPIRAQTAPKKLTIDDFRNSLRKEMNHKDIISTFGQPDKDVGSGIYIYIYTLADSSKVILGFTKSVHYAHHTDRNDKLISTLMKGE